MANYKRWAHEEDIVLMSHLSQEGKTEGFKRAAEELGRSIPACRARYYNVLTAQSQTEIEPEVKQIEEQKQPKEAKRGFLSFLKSLFKTNK